MIPLPSDYTQRLNKTECYSEDSNYRSDRYTERPIVDVINIDGIVNDRSKGNPSHNIVDHCHISDSSHMTGLGVLHDHRLIRFH